jgi:hypothetical protein
MRRQSPAAIRSILGLTAIKTLLTQIAKRPMSQPEIIEATGLANSTVSKYLKVLHTSPNLVYIDHWTRRNMRGNWQAKWALGYMLSDAPRPKPMTTAQYCARYRAKQIKKGLLDE